MKKLSKNEFGFGTIEILLFFLIVVIITAVGYYVWHSKNNANNSSTSASTSSTITKPTVAKSTTTTKYLTISEFGIKLPLTEGASDLTYTFSNNVATLHSVALKNNINQSDPKYSCFGVPATDVVGTIEIFSPNPVRTQPTVTVGGKGYTFSGAYNGSCVLTNPNAQKVNDYIEKSQTAATNAVLKAVQSN